MPNAKSERRNFRRVFTDEEAVLLYDGRHQTAKLRNLSGGGAQLVTPARPDIGTEVVLYADEFGRFEGKIARHTPFGVGINIAADDDQARHIVKRLEEYAGRGAPNSPLLQFLDAKRILLEALALSGNIAGQRAQWSENFWKAAKECQREGWITTTPINPEFDMIELTTKGRKALGA